MRNIFKRESVLLLISMIVFFTIIEPSYFNRIEILNSFNSVGKIVIAVCVLLYFIVIKRKIDIYIMLIAGFELSGIISTILNKGAFFECFRKGAYVLALALFMSIMIDLNPKILLKALSVVLGVYVHINMITRILYPDGLYVSELTGYKNCWFLGYDNLAAIIIILAQTVSVFRIAVNKNKAMVWDKSVVIDGAAFLFWQQIATGILAECLFFSIIILMKSPVIRKTIGKAKLFVVSMFLLFILLQFFSVQQNEAVIRMFARFGKDVTLMYRMLLWKKVWKDISSTWPFWGFGLHNGLDYVSRFGRVSATHFHCNYLQVFYEGGMIGITLLFAMFYYPACCFDRRKKEYSSMIILGGLTAILLIWQVEAYFTVTTYFIIALTLLNYSDKLEDSVLPETGKLRKRRKIVIVGGWQHETL